MTMDPAREKLMDRILKLLAVASSTTFSEEADTARKLAQELMDKHNVSLDAKDRAVFAWEEYIPQFKRAMWEWHMAEAVTRLCGCALFGLGRGEYEYGQYLTFNFAGTVSNLEACRYIMRKLHEQRVRDWLAYKRTGPDSFNKFCFGYARGVYNKVQTITRTVPELSAVVKAAALWYEASHKVNHTNENLGSASSKAGLMAGQSASFHRGEFSAGGRQRMLK